ncbi:MAG: glycosyltransferase family 4 protein, partial [Spirochaetes bacterium]|nr:glycosyltransferase family 4 protein [Spirochaetota bacterium]
MLSVMQKKICHITTVHPRYDIRIFHKECQSLAKNYQVSLIVADGLGDEVKEGIHIYDIGKVRGRLKRMLRLPAKAYIKALELDAAIYHFHDPELIKAGLKLKQRGKKVIYDVHEDVPRQIQTKNYIPFIIRPLIAFCFEKIEDRFSKKLDFIITATPHICDRFQKINPRCLDINNYPIIKELQNKIEWNKKENVVCYIGGMTPVRGILQMVNALAYVKKDVKLLIAGKFNNQKFYHQIQQVPGWEKVIELGLISRQEVKALLARSKGGIIPFLKAPNHIHAQPNKMYEYMLAGVPVLASDFPLWKDFVEKNKCGLTFNSQDSRSIAAVIDSIIENPQQAEQWAINGQNAVIEKFRWYEEQKKLH